MIGTVACTFAFSIAFTSILNIRWIPLVIMWFAPFVSECHLLPEEQMMLGVATPHKINQQCTACTVM